MLSPPQLFVDNRSILPGPLAVTGHAPVAAGRFQSPPDNVPPRPLFDSATSTTLTGTFTGYSDLYAPHFA